MAFELAAAPIPPGLEARARRIAERVGALAYALPPPVATIAARISTVSDVVLKALLETPELLSQRVLDSAPLTAETITAGLQLHGLGEPEAMAALRQVRNVELARIAWRDLAGSADVERSLLDLSALADGMVAAALDYAEENLASRYGRPENDAGKSARLLVLGMGKLGGRELNYSSDIDLVFLYPDEAQLPGRERADIEEYFTRLAQLLIKLLDQVTEHGFVFRVDTRLRPFGTSGPLVLSVSALETYLLQHGRDWERYAYVKARLLTGTEYQRAVFDEILTPFVYRRYLDFGVFDALRTMKRLISQEVARKDLRDNIKLGPGGIREIEFITQVFQLVRGGRVAALRTPSLLAALPLLEEHAQLAPTAVTTLLAAYRYLRTIENRLQSLEDQQTHDLPVDEERRARLVFALGARDWATLVADIDAHRQAVEREFSRVAWEGGGGREARAEWEELRTAWEAGAIAEALAGTALGADAEAVRIGIAADHAGGQRDPRRGRQQGQRRPQHRRRLCHRHQARQDSGAGRERRHGRHRGHLHAERARRSQQGSAAG